MQIKNFSIKKFGIFSSNIAASQTLEKPELETKKLGEPVVEARERRKTLLIVNARTTKQAIDKALADASNKKDVPVWIIYTSRPPLLIEGKNEGEADYEFAFQLQHGRGVLDSISERAKNLLIHRVETSFIWADSSADLINRNSEPTDSIIDLSVG